MYTLSPIKCTVVRWYIEKQNILEREQKVIHWTKATRGDYTRTDGGEDCLTTVDVLLLVNCFLSFHLENCYLCICELFQSQIWQLLYAVVIYVLVIRYKYQIQFKSLCSFLCSNFVFLKQIQLCIIVHLKKKYFHEIGTQKRTFWFHFD